MQRTECKVPDRPSDDFGVFYRVVKMRGYLSYPAVRDTAACPFLRND